MSIYSVSVYLSDDFRRTSHFMGDDGFEQAKADECYPSSPNFSGIVSADSHETAAEVAFAICNSYPDELHCDPDYVLEVKRYRDDKNRSLSVGDLVQISLMVASHPDDGFYGVDRVGFKRVEKSQGNA